MFSTNHFYRAYRAFQSAYEQSHTKCLKQRRMILIFLISSCIILGRFPTDSIYTRSEAAGLAEIFKPICSSIAKGNLAGFRKTMDFKSPHAKWLMHHRVFLQLRNRCEVLLWRCLARQVFILNGNRGDADNRRAPTLSLDDVLVVASGLEKSSAPETTTPKSRRERYVDPDLVDDEDSSEADGDNVAIPDLMEIECIFTALVGQGLLNGYISHSQSRFAIQGAKRIGPLNAGFPNIWETIKSRADSEVPGWKESSAVKANAVEAGRYGPGSVVTLTGARPAGAPP